MDAAVKTFTGAVGQQRVPAHFLANLELPVPPVEIQRRIAAQLKAQLAEVDKARQAAEAQLQDAVILKSKALESIFGSIKEWEPIGTFAKVQSGYAFKSDTFQATGTRLLRNANILPGKVYWDESVSLNDKDAEEFPKYKLNEGDILISLDRPIISSGVKVAQVSSRDLPALLVQRVGRFLIDHKRIDPDFLYAYLQTDQFISEITGHDQSLGVPHISPSQVENIKIPLPKLSTQQKLSNKLNEIMWLWREVTIASKTQLNDIDILPQKILAQAFKN